MIVSQRDSRWSGIKLGTSKMFSFHVIFSRMFGSINKFKVINPIIRSIMIYVMNSFACIKLSTKMLFHNISMFKKSFTHNLNKYISILPQNFSAFPSRMVFTIISFYFRLINRIILFTTRYRTITNNKLHSISSYKKIISTVFASSSPTFNTIQEWSDYVFLSKLFFTPPTNSFSICHTSNSTQDNNICQ